MRVVVNIPMVPRFVTCAWCGRGGVERSMMDGICVRCWERSEREVMTVVREEDADESHGRGRYFGRA